MWDLLNYTLVGFFLGIVAQLLVPKRRTGQPAGFLVTIVPSVIGSLLGGLASWYFWPLVDGQFQMAGFALSILGAVCLLWLFVAYLRLRGELT